MLKTNKITKKQLSILAKFTTNKHKHSKFLNEIHENDSFYTACDGIRIGVLFKSYPNDIFKPLNDDGYNNILTYFKSEYMEKDNPTRAKIEVNKNQLIGSLKEIKKDIGQFVKSYLSIPVQLEITGHNLVLSSKLYGVFKHEALRQMGVYNLNEIDQKVAYNIKYLIECLELTSNTEFITLTFSNQPTSTLLIECEQTASLLLPINLKTEGAGEHD
jgi:hypothetical protein